MSRREEHAGLAGSGLVCRQLFRLLGFDGCAGTQKISVVAGVSRPVPLRAEYRSFTAGLRSDDPSQVRALAEEFKTNATVAALSIKERRKLGDEAFTQYAKTVLADDHLTVDEEMTFTEVSDALGIQQQDFEGRHKSVLERMVIAQA